MAAKTRPAATVIDWSSPGGDRTGGASGVKGGGAGKFDDAIDDIYADALYKDADQTAITDVTYSPTTDGTGNIGTTTKTFRQVCAGIIYFDASRRFRVKGNSIVAEYYNGSAWEEMGGFSPANPV